MSEKYEYHRNHCRTCNEIPKDRAVTDRDSLTVTHSLAERGGKGRHTGVVLSACGGPGENEALSD